MDSTAMQATIFGDILPHVNEHESYEKILQKKKKVWCEEKSANDCPEEFQTSQRLGPSMSIT